MKIILSPTCKSLNGMLNGHYGYAVQKRKNGFYGVRTTHRDIPPDGHLRFILACAQLARTHLYIADIRLSTEELCDALVEAHYFIAAQKAKANANAKATYDARDIINLQHTFGL